MRKGVAVHFACNDPDNGNFAGKAGMAAVSIGGELMDLELDFMGGVKFTETNEAIRIHPPNIQDQRRHTLVRQLVLECLPNALPRISEADTHAGSQRLALHWRNRPLERCLRRPRPEGFIAISVQAFKKVAHPPRFERGASAFGGHRPVAVSRG